MLKLKPKTWNKFLVVGSVVFLALIATFWFKTKSDHVENNLSPEEVIALVEKLVVLPLGEEPTIATVTNLAELSKQEFFKNAKVGDKVIIYAEAGRAILYSPVENKIVEMAPLNKDLIGN